MEIQVKQDINYTGKNNIRIITTTDENNDLTYKIQVDYLMAKKLLEVIESKLIESLKQEMQEFRAKMIKEREWTLSDIFDSSTYKGMIKELKKLEGK